MNSHGILHDGEAETGAPRRTGASVVNTVKAFEYMGQMPGVYPFSIVPYLEIARVIGTDVYLSASAVGYGVVYQVVEY